MTSNLSTASVVSGRLVLSRAEQPKSAEEFEGTIYALQAIAVKGNSAVLSAIRMQVQKCCVMPTAIQALSAFGRKSDTPITYSFYKRKFYIL